MISGNDETQIVKTLGKYRAERFNTHPDVIELYTELAYIRRAVVKQAIQKNQHILKSTVAKQRAGAGAGGSRGEQEQEGPLLTAQGNVKPLFLLRLFWFCSR